MSQLTLIGAFNKHFLEFVDEIEKLFPDHKGIRGGKVSLIAIKRLIQKCLYSVGKNMCQISIVMTLIMETQMLL